jgi:hypothetical protein
MFYTLKEAGLPLNSSHDALRGHLHDALRAANGVPKDSWSSDGPWVRDTFPTHVVFSIGGQLYKQAYTVEQGAAGSDPTITLKGDKSKVHVAYSDNKEAAKESQVLFLSLDGDVTVTQESDKADVEVKESIGFEAVIVKEGKKTAHTPVKLIAPGWGSMAYYSKEVLKRDGPSVFKKGTHMMWNHPTDTEEAERPEGDLSNLAAVLMKDAEWMDEGPKGPGLYSEAKIFSDYATQIEEKGPHTGISINAGIKCHEGTIDGRSGRIADKFTHAYSADFVTKAGAGGTVVVNEALRTPTEEQIMTPEEIKALEARAKASDEENLRLKQQAATREAQDHRQSAYDSVSAILTEADIPFNKSILTRSVATPVIKDGKVDEAWIKSVAADFSDGITGKVTGNGTKVTKENETEEAQTKKNLDARMKESLKKMGVPEAGMEVAVKGRG